MGTSQSAPAKKREEEEEEEDDEEEWEGEESEGELHEESVEKERIEQQKDVKDKLEQAPELVPSASSASPVSPQLSSVTASHLGPSVRVWDPGHVLSPSPFQAQGAGSFNNRMVDRMLPGALSEGNDICTEIYLIRHGESNMNALPDLIGGRTPTAVLTAEGKRQARALGVFMLSHGVRFDAVFSSPLERCKQTAICVCQEVNFAQEKIEFGDALMEISQGIWEGLRRPDIYTPELVKVMNNSQPDFHAPGGESQRQVEFRMVEFINNVILPKAVQSNLQPNTGLYYNKKQSKSNSTMHVHPVEDAKSSEPVMLHTNLFVKGSAKSRFAISSKGEASASERLNSNFQTAAPYSVAVFSHGMAIKCLLRGILGSDPGMTRKLRIDNTSMTVLKHSTYHGWQIQRMNDTAHLRLL